MTLDSSSLSFCSEFRIHLSLLPGDKARFGLALSSTIHHPLIIAKLNKVQLEGFKARRMNQALKGYSTDKT